MFDQLKQMATQQLMSKMASNVLGTKETEEAATEGASGIMEVLKAQLAGGNLDQVMDLFSGGSMENNSFFAAAKAKIVEILLSKGMNAADASTEAARTTPDLINTLKDKFLSKDDADSAFDLNALTSLIPGGAGGLLKNAGGVGGLLGKAKGLFG